MGNCYWNFKSKAQRSTAKISILIGKNEGNDRKYSGIIQGKIGREPGKEKKKDAEGRDGREKGWLEGYRLSEKVDNLVNFTDIEVTPKVPYMFQAIAREDKGAVGGVEYNKSPAVLFKTSSDEAAGAPILPGITNEQLIIIVIAIFSKSLLNFTDIKLTVRVTVEGYS